MAADPPSEDWEFVERVTNRARGLRTELLDLLQADGPSIKAADLLPSIRTKHVDLIELQFQLDRLVEEGKADGSPGTGYRLP